VQQLIRAEAENLDDLRIEPGDGALGELDDEVVERRARALNAGGNFRRQGAVAVVTQPAAGKRDSRWEGRRCRRIPR
jgi:hypothetical protein